MFDPIINEKLNRLLEGGGYSEPGKVYTFDGNDDGKTKIPMQGEFVGVKISNDIPNVEQITKVVMEADADGEHQVIEMTPEMWTIYTASNGFKGLLVDGETFFVFVSDGSENESGFCVAANDFAHISRVEFAETIHPIDPKYLPGVCLPVVELSTVIKNGASFTEEENAKLNAAFETGAPFVVKCDISISDSVYYSGCSAVAQIGNLDTNRVAYWSQGSTCYTLIFSSGAGWIAQFL